MSACCAWAASCWQQCLTDWGVLSHKTSTNSFDLRIYASHATAFTCRPEVPLLRRSKSSPELLLHIGSAILLAQFQISTCVSNSVKMINECNSSFVIFTINIWLTSNRAVYNTLQVKLLCSRSSWKNVKIIYDWIFFFLLSELILEVGWVLPLRFLDLLGAASAFGDCWVEILESSVFSRSDSDDLHFSSVSVSPCTQLILGIEV